VKVFPCGQRFELAEAHQLWRRFMATQNSLTWDPELGWLPSPYSNALQMDPDLSTSWRQHLIRHRAGPLAVLGADGRYTLVGEMAVGDGRRLGFGVRHSPTGCVTPDCSHASVDWPPDSIRPGKVEPSPSERKRLKYDLSRQFRFVYGPLPQPPEGALQSKG
jgi:hypothetical protein